MRRALYGLLGQPSPLDAGFLRGGASDLGLDMGLLSGQRGATRKRPAKQAGGARRPSGEGVPRWGDYTPIHSTSQSKSPPQAGGLLPCFGLVARCVWEGHWREEYAMVSKSHLALWTPLRAADPNSANFANAAIPPNAPNATAARHEALTSPPLAAKTRRVASSKASPRTKIPALAVPLLDVTATRVLGRPDPAPCSAQTGGSIQGGSPLPGFPCLVVETVGRCHYLCFGSTALLARFKTALNLRLAQAQAQAQESAAPAHHPPANRGLWGDATRGPGSSGGVDPADADGWIGGGSY